MSKPKPITIKSAEQIAKHFGYEQVIILGRKTGEQGLEHLTTYGINKEHCGAAAKIGNFLKHKVMGWPNA